MTADKSDFRPYLKRGQKIALVVEELVGDRVQLFAHGKEGNTSYVGYTMLGGQTFVIVDKTRGTGRKTEIIDSLAINTRHIVYITPYNGPPKV